MVGKKKGLSGKYGGLYLWSVRALEIKKPLFFVAENVGGLASSGHGLSTIIKDLKRIGYQVFQQVYRFEEYGIPQSRHRIILIGFRKDLRIDSFNHPPPTTRSNPTTSRKALQNIGPDAKNNELTKHSSTALERLRYIRPGENVFTVKIPKHLQLKMKSRATISQIYRRLDPDKPAYTVTGSGGGGNSSIIGKRTEL